MKKILTLFSLVLLVSACGLFGDDEPERPPTLAELIGDDATHPLQSLIRLQSQFPDSSWLLPVQSTVEGPPRQGGHLMASVLTDSPVPGIFNPIFYSSGMDADMFGWFLGGSLFSSTPGKQYGQHGVVQFEFDIDEQSLTMWMVEDVTWHDGTPLTLDDLVFAIESISHPLYEAAGGIRWSTVEKIRGTQAFKDGAATSISGLELSENNRRLKIYFDVFSPDILYFGFWSYPYPRHIWQGIPLEEQPAHARTRTDIVGWGPFVVQNVVPGESVYLTAFEDYWLGRPLLDEVTVRVVSSSLVPDMMRSGQFDIMDFPLMFYPDNLNPTNFNYLGTVGNIFSIIAFRLGYYDTEAGEVVHLENPRLADPRVRHALGYALNEDLIAQQIYNGLRISATSIIPPGHEWALDPSLRGHYYNPEKANQLLDEAGWTERDAQGFRKNAQGEEITLIFVARLADDWVLRSQQYIQDWAAVGVRVELYEGTLHEFANMSQNVWNGDNWEYDIAEAAWQAGYDPHPEGLWGSTINNRARYLGEGWVDIFEEMRSPAAWDADSLVDMYHRWQNMFYDTASVIVTDWRISLIAVNNRVMGYQLGTTLPIDGERTVGGAHRIWLSQDTRF